MKKFLIVLLLISGLAFAQVDTAIIATDIASVDMLSARAAANKAGLPIFIAENGEVNDELLQILSDNEISKIVIVGGPAVVKEEAKNALEDAGYDVVRLWGFERTATALEIAKHFWPEGVSCATLVEDTKDPEADTSLQLYASDLAVHENCVLIPIPRDTLPADVLATLEYLEVSDVRFVGREIKSEIKERLTKYKLKETTGTDEEIEIEVETEVSEGSTKLIIIAAPNWKHTLSIGANPGKGTIVKKLNSADQTDRLINFINDHTFDEIKVVGEPGLAGEISTVLEVAGITVDEIKDARPAAIAKRLYEAKKDEWKVLYDKNKKDQNKVTTKIKIRVKIRTLADDTESELDELEIEIEASGEDVTELKAKLKIARDRIKQARAKISNIDIALDLVTRARDEFKADLWTDRVRVKWKYEHRLEAEEADIETIERNSDREIKRLVDDIKTLKDRCNSEIIEDLVNKAKSLRDVAKEEDDAGNHGRVAELRLEVNSLVEQAKKIRTICERGEDLSDDLHKTVVRRDAKSTDIVKRIAPLKVDTLHKVRTLTEVKALRIDNSGSGSSSAVPAPGTTGVVETIVVTSTDDNSGSNSGSRDEISTTD